MKIEKKYEFKRELKCKRCGKKLKNYQSQVQGYGPKCYELHLQEIRKIVKRRLF